MYIFSPGGPSSPKDQRMGSGITVAWDLIPIPQLTSCVNLGNRLHLCPAVSPGITEIPIVPTSLGSCEDQT